MENGGMELSGLEMDERNRLIGENVRKYRLLKGMTQDELAQGLCSVSQLSKMENGKTYIKRTMLKEMAQRLGATMEQLETADAMLDEIKEIYQMGTELSVAGNHVKALELFQEGVAKSRQLGYPEMVVMGTSKVAFVLIFVQRDFGQAIRLLEGAFAEGLPLRGDDLVVYLLYLGEAYQYQGNRVVAYEHYCRADEAFQELEEDDGWVRVSNLFNLSRSHFWMGTMRTALRYIEQVEQIARDTGKHVWYVRSLLQKALTLTQLGEYERAVETYEMIQREAQGSSRMMELGVAHMYCGLLNFKMGSLVDAIRQLDKAIKVYDLIDERFHRCEALVCLAEIYYQMGEWEKVEAYVHEAVEIAKRIPHNTMIARAKAHRILGWLCRDRGEFEEYVTHLEAALESYGEQHIGEEPYEVAVELAAALYEREDERALEMYHRATRYGQRTLEFMQQIR